MRYILASASPRRKELLTQMGLEFEIIPAKGDEVITTTNPDQVVMELAEQKAGEVADGLSESFYGIVIGADTVVVHENKILGKPKDAKDAVRMLQQLSGQVHQVYTGVSLICLGGESRQVHTFYEATDVWMHQLSEDEIRDYVASEEPLDKAGSYGIQGRGGIFIDRIQGDYNNVVGLPIARLYQELKHFSDSH